MKFTESHEWIVFNQTETIGIVGITQYAQKELGEIVYLELPTIGKYVKAGEEVVVLESTKAATDLYSPVSGTILDVNKTLISAPEKVNAQPETEGWLFKIELSDPQEVNLLLNAEIVDRQKE